MKEKKYETLLDSIEKGRAKYNNGYDYYLPKEGIERGIVVTTKSGKQRLSLEEAVPYLCNNCMIAIGPGKKYIILSAELTCPRVYEHRLIGEKVFAVIDGKTIEQKKMCESCQHYLKSLVNECENTEATFKGLQNQHIRSKISDELRAFPEVKKGYISYSNFSEDIHEFSREYVEERIEEFRSRGKFTAKKQKVEQKTCVGCIRYKSRVCPGITRSTINTRKDGHCRLTKEAFTERMEQEVIHRYGSLAKAFWFFSQCGTEIDYKDPCTKRQSRRYISLPAKGPFSTKIEGFKMCSVNYPLYISSSKHETYISAKEFKKEFPNDVKRTKRYSKKYKDIVLAAEAYRKGKEQGQDILTSGHHNYLAYAKIGERDNWLSPRRRDIYFIIGAQTSSNTVYPVSIEDIVELLKETADVKGMWIGWR